MTSPGGPDDRSTAGRIVRMAGRGSDPRTPLAVHTLVLVAVSALVVVVLGIVLLAVWLS